MRELTKSMMRFSWAVPLFGLRQMTNLAMPTSANLANATRAFEAVTGTVERELGSAFADLFKAGDQLVDTMTGDCGSCSGATFNPMSWIPKPSSGSLGSGGASGSASSRTASTGAANTGTASSAPVGAGATASPAAHPQPTASNDVGGWGPIPNS